MVGRCRGGDGRPAAGEILSTRQEQPAAEPGGADADGVEDTADGGGDVDVKDGVDDAAQGLEAAAEAIGADAKEGGGEPLNANGVEEASSGDADPRFGASVHKAIWDAALYCLSKPEHKAALVERAAEVRAAFVDLMQRHPAFEKVQIRGTEARVAAFEDAIVNLLAGHRPGPVPSGMRSRMIAEARREKAGCALCGEALGPSDDLLHIDHIVPLARGDISRRRDMLYATPR